MSLSACLLSRLYREVADKPTYLSDVQETNEKGRSQTSLTSGPEHVEQVTSTFILTVKPVLRDHSKIDNTKAN